MYVPLRVAAFTPGFALAFTLLLSAAQVHAAVATSARLKVFAATTQLRTHDIRRVAGGGAQSRLQFDARGHVALTDEHWRAELDGELTGSAADRLRGVPGTVDPYGAHDGLRYFDFATVTARSQERAVRGRIDRLLIGYRDAQFAFVVGRQAVSWGNGLVFQPFDLFNPFAPVETDRDYKDGDDLALAQWTSADGRDVQLLAVARRAADGRRELAAGSVGAKWQQPLAAGEFALLVAQHAGDAVFGFGWNMPVGEAVVRADWVVTRLDAHTWRHSAVINMDRSFVIDTRNVYGFVEIYRNGFGAAATPRDLSKLDPALQIRLQRGEVFTLSRWYGAVGATVEWNPLWKQTALVIASAQDGSMLVQSTVRYEPGDRSVTEAGVTWGAGGSGDEFGGVPVLRTPPGVQAPTLGGGLTAHLRVAWYW